MSGDCCPSSCGSSGKFFKNLDGIFHPQSVAIVGASANSEKIGYQILHNVIGGGFKGKIFPINPKDKEILGVPAYASLLDVPGAIDLVVVAVPAPYVYATV